MLTLYNRISLTTTKWQLGMWNRPSWVRADTPGEKAFGKSGTNPSFVFFMMQKDQKDSEVTEWYGTMFKTAKCKIGTCTVGLCY